MHNNYRLCIIIRYGHGTFSNICNGHTKTGILFTFDNKKKNTKCPLIPSVAFVTVRLRRHLVRDILWFQVCSVYRRVELTFLR